MIEYRYLVYIGVAMTTENEKIIETDDSTIGEEESIEIQEQETEIKHVQQKNKTKEAKILLAESKSMLAKSQAEDTDCRLVLQSDLEAYYNVRNRFSEGILSKTNSLLLKLGFFVDTPVQSEKPLANFEAKDEVKQVVLKNVRTGRFTGLILSMLAGTAALGAFGYWLSLKSDIKFSLFRMISGENIQQVFAWVAAAVKRPDDIVVGAAVLGLATLALMTLVYVLRVSLKGRKNLHLVKVQRDETEAYVAYKAKCKKEMEYLGTHLNASIKTVEDYGVLLEEQSAKLQRIIYFEEIKEKLSEYHNPSKQIMEETQSLIDAIEGFIGIEMSEKGRLAEDNVYALENTKRFLDKFLSRLSV